MSLNARKAQQQAKSSSSTTTSHKKKEHSCTPPRQPQTPQSPPTVQQRRHLREYIPPHLRDYVFPHHGDFCFTPIFHDQLLAQLMLEGFLPIATPDVCLPKLHEHRCVLRPIATALHISKSTRKKASKFVLTINRDFDRVVQGCRYQHGGSCWLYPNLVRCFRRLHEQPFSHPAAIGTLRLYSVELWKRHDNIVKDENESENHTSMEAETETEDELVAGELGYTVGSIYTSLTGFSSEDSAGSVQLAALGCLLQRSGFETWDLGMVMDYKTRLGAEIMERDDFVRLVQSVRQTQSHLQLLPIQDPGESSFTTSSCGQWNCRQLLDQIHPKSTTVVTDTPKINRQHKKAKVENEQT